MPGVVVCATRRGKRALNRLSVYVPHAKFEQNPGTAETVNDRFDAVAYGTSQSAVDSAFSVQVEDCN